MNDNQSDPHLRQATIAETQASRTLAKRILVWLAPSILTAAMTWLIFQSPKNETALAFSVILLIIFGCSLIDYSLKIKKDPPKQFAAAKWALLFACLQIPLIPLVWISLVLFLGM